MPVNLPPFLKTQMPERGFTLIELSIVLVIIGLIVGGVLVGQDLIKAAEVRSTISQIEKYNAAVNTFKTKYNGLPGDMTYMQATAFGFSPRSLSTAGEGDGNGVIEGYTGSVQDGFSQSGEVLSFWVDLTVGNPSSSLNINLIDGTFSAYTGPTAAAPAITASNAASYLPAAKLGRGNFIYVYSTGSVNYFGIAPITTTAATGMANALTATMTVQQAFLIDKKIDDGFPAAGNVTATWDSGTLAENASAPTVNAGAVDSSTSCYNTSGGSTPGAYSLAPNSSSNPTCALSFRFQ